jgi:hypothetical protein
LKLAIAQDHQYAGSNFWNWRAWIEGKPADLDKVEKVKWFLHPSFSPPVVVSRDRGTGFRLERSGWGTFTLRAQARCVDGSELTLRQPLKLFYPDDDAGANAKALRTADTGTPGAVERVTRRALAQGVRKVFLSYASSDRSAALPIRRALETLGMTVVDGSAIGSGQPVEIATLDLLTSADATVAFTSSDLPSAFVAQEINASVRAGKPTLVLTNEELSPDSGLSSGVQVLQLDPADASGIAAAVTKFASAGGTG